MSSSRHGHDSHLALESPTRGLSLAGRGCARGEFVWNGCNETDRYAIERNGEFLSGFDLCNLSAGVTKAAAEIGEPMRISADTVQRICVEYAARRFAARKQRLRWRASRGAKRALGWVPFKAVRHGKKITRLRRKVARQARDSAHKVSSRIVTRYQRRAIGDVGTQVMRGTCIGMLRGFVQYKCQQADASSSYRSNANKASGPEAQPA
jgi:hypothetical protein